MALFPDIYPSYDYKIIQHWKNLRLGLTDGDFLQRRKKRTSPLHEFVMKWKTLTASEERQLWDFYYARSGGFEAFAFFDFASRSYTSQNIGTGDGVQTTFDAGAKNISNYTVYVDGNQKTEGTHYNVSSGTGTDGQDQIVFTAGNEPGNGEAVTLDYTGNKYYSTCVFTQDSLDSSNFITVLHTIGLSVMEVTQ
jgi:hypothetical protein